MKKYIRLAAILMLIMMLVCSCRGRRATNAGYELYRSSPVGVEIEYPDFWETAEDKQARTVAFATPNEGFADEYRDNVTIVSENLKERGVSFDDYVNMFMSQLPSTYSEYKKISENEVKANGYDAFNTVYECQGTDERELRVSQTFIESGDYAYIFTFIAEPKSYDYFNNNAQVMLSTIKLLRK